MPLRNIALIGCGNISNTRHLPALQKRANRARITALASASPTALEATASRLQGVDTLLVSPTGDVRAQFEQAAWFRDIDACIIGTPPWSHGPLTEIFLTLGKDVLVEKPFAMDVEEADSLVELGQRTGGVLAVMHNFQYALGMQRLRKIVEERTFGEIRSFFMVQFTNRNRRLPVWYDELPLGLFYDEASHFFYLLELLGGPLQVNGASILRYHNRGNTPTTITATLEAGGIPASLYINTDSPVCEWLFGVCFERRWVVYDFFRDILIRLPADNSHRAGDVFRTSMLATLQHWAGFVASGWRMVSGNLLYGHLEVIDRFLDGIDSRNLCPDIAGARGRETVRAMSSIVELSSLDANTNRK